MIQQRHTLSIANQVEACIHTKNCTFIAILFIIAKTWKHQDRCPSTDQWKNKLWYIDNGILFSAKKK